MGNAGQPLLAGILSKLTVFIFQYIMEVICKRERKRRIMAETSNEKIQEVGRNIQEEM